MSVKSAKGGLKEPIAPKRLLQNQSALVADLGVEGYSSMYFTDDILYVGGLFNTPIQWKQAEQGGKRWKSKP